MTSIKVKFRPSSAEGKKGTIYYQIIHHRTIRQLKTDHHVFTDDWDKHKADLILDRNNTERYRDLYFIRKQIRREVGRLEKIAAEMPKLPHDEYTANTIIDIFRDTASQQSFFNFTENIIGQLKRLNRERTAENYTAALNSFSCFLDKKDIWWDDVTSDLIQEYEAYLKARNITMNTVSFYMRILRAVYNRAVEKGFTEQHHPFRHVYTGVDKTAKRALTIKDIKKIKELDLASRPNLDLARDLFMLSFYTRGMAFVDMAYLRKSDLKNSMLTYRRRKTGQQLSIKWEKCMQEIINKYAATTVSTPFLLPIITTADMQKAHAQYKNRLYMVNSYLKQVAQSVGLPIPLTTYVARHSWASIARNKNIPLAVISESMGHDSETTTQIYLASIECNIIHKANSLILKDL